MIELIAIMLATFNAGGLLFLIRHDPIFQHVRG